MARTKISEFSATPANNTDIDSINLAEGCAPSGINDAIRELMSQLKDFQAGTAGDSFNGPVGATTATTGAFTTLAASGAVTLSGGTANGVVYANGSKVLTSGSALTFDGTNLGVNISGPTFPLTRNGITLKASGSDGAEFVILSNTDSGYTGFAITRTGADSYLSNRTNGALVFSTNNSEQMRLTSTGLGIGTSSPDTKLTVSGTVKSSIDGTANNKFFTLADTASGGKEWGLYNRNGGTAGLFAIRNVTDNITALTLDSSGNLGLGVTPSAWGAGKAMEFNAKGNAIWGLGTNSMWVASNVYFDGSYKYANNDFANILRVGSNNGQFEFLTAPSGTAGNAISFTQAMTLDASGRNLIGLTSTQSNNARLQVKRTDATVGASTYSIGWLQNATGYEDGLNVLVTDQVVTLAADYAGSNHGTSLVFATNGGASAFGATERARIDSSGNLLVGTTSGSYKVDVSGDVNVTGSYRVNGVATTGLTGGQTGSAPLYGARAWVNFNGTGTVAIRASGNVSSITDNGTGDYTVNFTTAMPDATYSINGSVVTVASAIGVFGSRTGTTDWEKTTTTFRVGTYNINASMPGDYNAVNISVFR